MPLSNYTSSQTVDKSLAEITKALVRAGAAGLATRYDEHGAPVALAFALPWQDRELQYLLPLRPDEVAAVLTRQQVEPRYLRPEHVQRVAWRILRDWVVSQVAMIESGMLTLPEVMFPYMRTTAEGPTVWQEWELSEGRRLGPRRIKAVE
jgi:hypothetical protein